MSGLFGLMEEEDTGEGQRRRAKGIMDLRGPSSKRMPSYRPLLTQPPTLSLACG